MPYQLIAKGDAATLGEIEKYQPYFPEDSEGMLEVELRAQVASDIVSWLDEKLEAQGVPKSAVQVDGRLIKISFRTEIAPLVLIAGAIASVIFLVGLVVAWKLFKLNPEAVVAGAVATSTGLILLIIGGAFVLLYLVATRGQLGFGSFSLGK